MLAKRIADAPATWISIPMWGRVFVTGRRLLGIDRARGRADDRHTQDSAVLIGGRWTPTLDGRTMPGRLAGDRGARSRT